MRTKQIEIPDDVAAKYTGSGQFEAFDAAFSKVATLPAEKVTQILEATKHKPTSDTKGRPHKAD
jgi:predicted Fe-Mo cluster-binding NifX family protein